MSQQGRGADTYACIYNYRYTCIQISKLTHVPIYTSACTYTLLYVLVVTLTECKALSASFRTIRLYAVTEIR